MKNKLFLGAISALSMIFSGCVGQPSIQKINDAEAFKYEKTYMAEYEKIKNKFTNFKSPIKWIQAANKKEKCKMFVGYNPNNDRTVKDGYKIYWDGKCKNGYAYGLGREFEKGLLTNLEAIAIYSGEEKEPEYYIQKDKLNNISMEGNINNGNFVKTTIEDNNMKFNIWYQYGHHAHKPGEIGMFINSSPFSDQITYIKAYPNFGYVIGDHTNNDLANINYVYNMVDGKTKQINGFTFEVAKNNHRYAGEKINGQAQRRVQLPQSYVNHFVNILNQVKNAGQVSINEQRKAQMVKTQYKNNICKDSIKVNFINNNEYKAICNEDKIIANLKEKIDIKLTKLDKQKQVKRDQQNQNRLIQAREQEAKAAQRRASAAESANFNQSMQNLNNNLQMQQLNNNLMMNNLMPKTHNVYIH